MTLAQVVTQLSTNLAQTTGVKRVYSEPPDLQVMTADCPAIIFEAVTIGVGGHNTQVKGRVIELQYTITFKVLTAPAGTTESVDEDVLALAILNKLYGAIEVSGYAFDSQLVDVFVIDQLQDNMGEPYQGFTFQWLVRSKSGITVAA